MFTPRFFYSHISFLDLPFLIFFYSTLNSKTPLDYIYFFYNMVAPIETQLRLEKFEENLYRSTEKLWKPPNARGVFGGVVIAQSLMAAARTVPEDFHVHSMHCYFIMAVREISPKSESV
jgi:hypothetical protein